MSSQSLKLNQKKKNIPNGWMIKRLEEFGTIVTGNTPTTSVHDYYGDNFQWASPADLGNVKYVKKTKRNLSLRGYKITRKIPAKSLLVVCIGSTIGKIGIATQNMTTNQQINSIICNDDDNDNEYVYYQLQFNSQKIQDMANNQAVPILNKHSFSKIEIKIPINIKEQQKISLFLSDIDELIYQLDYLIIKKNNIKQGTIQELLTGKRRLEGFDGKWKIKKLGNICQFENGDRGKNYPSESIQTKRGIPFVNAGHLVNTIEIDFKKMDYIPNEAYDLLSSGKIKKGDILFCLRGSLGKFSGVKNIEKGAIASSLIIVRPNKSNQIISEFILILFGMKKTSQLIEIYESSNAQPNLSGESLKKFNFLIPPIKEQIAIAKILSDMDLEIQGLEQKRDKYVMIKNGMMQKLLTGEIRLT